MYQKLKGGRSFRRREGVEIRNNEYLRNELSSFSSRTSFSWLGLAPAH